MMCGSINERSENLRNSCVPFVNGNRPEVDQSEHEQVGVLVHWEEEHIDVVGTTLQETVQWMKSVTSKRGGDLENKETEARNTKFSLLQSKSRFPKFF